MNKICRHKLGKFLFLFLAVCWAWAMLTGCSARDSKNSSTEMQPSTRQTDRKIMAVSTENRQDQVNPEKTSPAASPFSGAASTLLPGTDNSKMQASALPAVDQADSQSPGRKAETPPQPRKHTAEAAGKDKGIILNFDHAPLSDVIMTFAELLRINYILVADTVGEVTIQSADYLNKKDLFPLFYQILEINGLTAVKEGDLYKIISIKDAPRYQAAIRQPSTMPIPYAERGFQIQLVPLHHINTEEMTKILTPFISAEGAIISHEQTKTLILVDQRVNIKKALRLVETFDVSMFDRMNYRLFQLHNLGTTDVIPPLKQIIALVTRDSAEEIEIIELEKMNSLLVFSSDESIFARISELIGKLDIPSQDASPHIYIYFLKNSQSKDMVQLLNSIFLETEPTPLRTPEEKQKQAPGAENPFALKPPAAEPVKAAPKAVSDFGSETLRGKIKITEDPIRNALVIEAIPGDYLIVNKVLERLDILPRQVMISVSIFEVRLDDGLDLGVEWAYSHLTGDSKDHQSFWQGVLSGGGLMYGIGQANKWQATINALAQRKKINILSTPSVLASDNKEASIDIATEIPVASAQIQYDNDNTNKTQTDIQYRNTGIILNVTPHINEFGLVSMDISQEVSEESSPVKVGDSLYPSFFKRSVSTTLTVNNNQTIVIGGLIRETRDNSHTGVPFLVDLPIIGWLFGTSNKAEEKSELIILIKPSVVTTLDHIDAITVEFTQKAGYDLRGHL